MESRRILATFAGSVGAVFTSPRPSNATVGGVGTSTFTWGRGSAPNRFTFTPSSFDADANQVFSLGQLSYYNGTTTIGTEANSVDLALDLNFSKPAGGGLKSLRYNLGMSSTTNTNDPVASADSVDLGIGQSVSVTLGKQRYGLEILGFGPANGDPSQIRDRFFVQEGDTDSAELLARFEPTDIGLGGARWLSRQERGAGQPGASAIRFDWNSRGFGESFAVDVYQSDDAKFDRNDLKLGGSFTVDASQANSGQGTAYITAPPVRQGGLLSADRVPRFVLLVANPAGMANEANPRNNVVAVRVAQPKALSYELEETAPLASTRLERVQLWLEKYTSAIDATAGQRQVGRTEIAGVIAWEALVNAKPSGLFGPGKVHPFELSGTSAAAQVEKMGYLPRLGTIARTRLLKTPEGSIRYIGAIMGAFGDIAAREGVTAPIRTQPGILSTLYNGISLNGTPVRPDNAAAYFRHKNRVGGNYTPNPTMGRWVANRDNRAAIDSALNLRPGS